MKHSVFISYSRKDKAIVNPLVELLKTVNSEVFRDEDSIKPGELWEMVIEKTIDSAEKILVFWSDNSAVSEYVEKEYSQAIALEKLVVPILLDSTPLCTPLTKYKWIDLNPEPGPKPGGLIGRLFGGIFGGILDGTIGGAIGGIDPDMTGDSDANLNIALSGIIEHLNNMPPGNLREPE